MRSHAFRPARWWARTLILPVLVTSLVAGGTAANAAPGADLGTVTAISAPMPLTAQSNVMTAEPTCSVWFWRQGVEVWVSVRNLAPTTVTGWTLTWTMPTWQPVAVVWNAALVSQVGGTVTVQNLAWNSVLAPGVAVTIGYIANGIAPPGAFALNGAPCPIG